MILKSKSLKDERHVECEIQVLVHIWHEMRQNIQGASGSLDSVACKPEQGPKPSSSFGDASLQEDSLLL